jgi:hypothetical protein
MIPIYYSLFLICGQNGYFRWLRKNCPASKGKELLEGSEVEFTKLGLRITNSIGKFSGGGLAYHL